MNTYNFIESQKKYFKSGKTKDINTRIDNLKKLLDNILLNEENIFNVLHKDLKKSNFESYLTEIAVLKSEVELVCKNLKKWSKPKKVKSTLANFPSKDYIYSEPYGTVLIISPWNYPFQLAILPLISAIAAGNTVVIKPSEHAPNTSALLEKIISSIFNENYVKVVQGDYKTSANLLELRWDYIFFTGSVKVGKIVAKAASNYITPVTLELGGKNPCIIDKSIDLKLAARRIVWGKFINAGQTCIAPDYILINKQIKLPFINALVNEIENAYGKDQFLSSDYPRIINKSNTERLISLLKNQKILYGGVYNKQENYLSPTLIDSPKLDSNLMKDEIFGPILPVIEYDNEAKIHEIISEFEKPLALYVFTTNTKFSDNIINKVSFGGGVINDTMIHFGNHRLPFGGVGQSGIGSYHGKSGFDLFSHFKPIVKKGNWLDIKTRYAPYNGKLSSLKRLLRLLN